MRRTGWPLWGILAGCAGGDLESSTKALLPEGWRSSSDVTAPTIVSVTVGDGSGWVSERATAVTIKGSDDVGVAALCVSTTTRCMGWVAAGQSINVTLPRGVGPHTVRAWARDHAGNISRMASTSVRLDGQAPVDGTVVLTAISGGITVSWAGFSDAGRGVDHYRVVGRASEVAPVCSGEEELEWEGSGGSVSFSGLGAGTYSFRVCAVDPFGRSSTGTIARGTAGSEGGAPVVENFGLESGVSYTATRAVTLAAEVSDDSLVTRMCFSEANSCTAWVDYAPTYAFNLSGGEGAKTVNAWFRDVWGNENVPVSAVINLDTTPPTNGTVTGTPGAGQAALSWSGFADVGSGVREYIVVRDIDRAPASCSVGTEVYRGTSTSYTDAGLFTGQRYGYRVCAVDNLDQVSSGANVNVTPLDELDAPAVSGVVLAGGLSAVHDRYVTLDISASDPSGLSRMCISNTPTCGTWRSYQASSYWTLEAGSYGSRTVYVWLEDGLGNQNLSPTSASIQFAPDADGDGFADGADCDDGNPAIHPGASSACAAVDIDCDGFTEEDADGDGEAAVVCGGLDCEDSNAAIGLAQCPWGASCQEILDLGLSVGDGTYPIDVDGWGTGVATELVICEMDAYGGGWTLVATKANLTALTASDMTSATPRGSASLTATYKAGAFAQVNFADLMFEDGSQFAVYEGVGDGSESYLDFQSSVDLPDCTRTSGHQYEMTQGNLAGGRLCDTDLYINPHDLDGYWENTCDVSRAWNGWATGPAWSTYNNDRCPLDDASNSSFVYPAPGYVPFRTPLRMWVR